MKKFGFLAVKRQGLDLLAIYGNSLKYSNTAFIIFLTNWKNEQRDLRVTPEVRDALKGLTDE